MSYSSCKVKLSKMHTHTHTYGNRAQAMQQTRCVTKCRRPPEKHSEKLETYQLPRFLFVKPPVKHKKNIHVKPKLQNHLFYMQEITIYDNRPSVL